MPPKTLMPVLLVHHFLKFSKPIFVYLLFRLYIVSNCNWMIKESRPFSFKSGSVGNISDNWCLSISTDKCALINKGS